MIVLSRSVNPVPPEGQHVAVIMRVSNLYTTQRGTKAVTVTFDVLHEKEKYTPLRKTYFLTQGRRAVQNLINFFEATGLSFEEGKAYTEEEIADMMQNMEGAIVRIEVVRTQTSDGREITVIGNLAEATDEEVAWGMKLLETRAPEDKEQKQEDKNIETPF